MTEERKDKPIMKRFLSRDDDAETKAAGRVECVNVYNHIKGDERSRQFWVYLKGGEGSFGGGGECSETEADAAEGNSCGAGTDEP